MILKRIGLQGLVCPHFGAMYMILPKSIKVFLSETTLYIDAKFHREDLYEGGS